MNQQTSKTNTGKIIRLLLIVVLLLTAWYSYRLVLGRPLNINHFANRVTIQTLLLFPQVITFLGLAENTPLDFHSDRLNDFSPAAQQHFWDMSRDNLQRLRQYNRAALSGQQALTYDYLDFRTGADLAAAEFPYHFTDLAYRGPYPANQTAGVQLSPLVTLTQMQQVVDADSAQRFLARVEALPEFLLNLRQSIEYRAELGVIPPRIIMRRLISQAELLLAAPAEEWGIYTVLDQHLESAGIDIAERQALQTRNRDLIENRVIPAYREYLADLESLEGRAPEAVGMWSLPEGDRYYEALLRIHTTSDLGADKIHALGLRRVAEVSVELDAALHALGYVDGSIGARIQALASSAESLYTVDEHVRERILADYTAMVRELEEETARAFRNIPPQEVEVRAVPRESEAGEAGAYYNPPALDGGRPGVFFVNLRAPEETQRFAMLTLSAHEAVPGHHFQTAVAQLLEGLPLVRTVDFIAAYGEGWALYTERLVHDLGLHDDFSNIGRLQAEMFRAVRLVVDTGIHAKRWSREQAIEYMREHTGDAEAAVVSEIERYIAMPGQACAYMIGMLEILALREEARERQGERFNLPDFHHAVLKNGPLPLAVLRREVEASLR